MSTVSEVPPADWELWRAFRSMNQQLSRELDRQLQRDAGISQADYAVLLVLFEAPGSMRRTGELADLLGWEKSRVSHQVARMERRALVERQDCETDGRGTWVVLQPAGKRALLGAMSQHAAAIRELFLSQLDDQEKEAIRRASRRILEKLNPEACRLEEGSAAGRGAA